MFVKSKKQKRSILKKEQSDTDFQYESDSITFLNQDQILVQPDVANLQKNLNIFSKKNKKEHKQQNLEKEKFQINNSKIISQNIDFESEIDLLEGFEGTELQKAFLFSEVFKNVNN